MPATSEFSPTCILARLRAKLAGNYSPQRPADRRRSFKESGLQAATNNPKNSPISIAADSSFILDPLVGFPNGHPSSFLSVVIVSYNVAGLLEECLASLLAEDLPLEIIVVDNASS